MLSTMLSYANKPSAKTIFSTAGSALASAMLVRSLAKDLIPYELIPYELRQYVSLRISRFLKSFSPEIVFIIEEYAGLASNKIYKAAEIYLKHKISPSAKNFVVSMAEKESKISKSMARDEEIVDKFNGVQFKWRRRDESDSSFRYFNGSDQERGKRYFELCFHKKHEEMVFHSYFPHILKECKNVNEEDKKTLKIHTLVNKYSGDLWHSIKLDHPATFETLGMDRELKKIIKDDLDRFVRRKEFYREVGKAWKRGYLLYGPPGTGKSSLIAAMANYLNFDIYDLELSDIDSNSDLRKLLINTANRSILVVEDIDCTLEAEDRKEREQALKILGSNKVRHARTVNVFGRDKKNQVSLSGLLNFIDGLWSSCGDERIIVFTTNHKEQLDPALLRPGRMDMHIHMSYCTPPAFETLAENYLKIRRDPPFAEHFAEIDNLLEEVMVTPAEVAEQLLRNEDPDGALADLIDFLHEKKREDDEIKAKISLEEQEGADEEETDVLHEGDE